MTELLKITGPLLILGWPLADLPMPAMSDVGQTLWTLAAIVIIVGMLLKVWNEGRSAFGRTPPLSDEMQAIEKALEKKIEESDRRRSVGIAGAHNAAERHASELRHEAALRNTELRDEIKDIKDQLGEIEKVNATLDERTKTTRHTIDSMNDKIDQLLRGSGPARK